jgi:hypothetical protein
MTAREVVTVEALKQMMERFERAIVQLREAYDKVRLIDLNSELTSDDDLYFEAFTSRFARASDIQLRKVFRIIEKLELEEFGTAIDLYNRAEKRGMIPDATAFREIRELRNEIAHEYRLREPKDIYSDALHLTPIMIASLPATSEYVTKLVKSLE